MGVDVAYLVVVVFVVAVYVVVAAIGNLRQLELTFKLGCGCVFFTVGVVVVAAAV